MMEFSLIAESTAVGPPDWFLPGSVSTSMLWEVADFQCALIAFSSKPFVHIFMMRVQRGEALQTSFHYVGQIHAHHERINGLSFCSYSVSVGSQLTELFSCGQDGLARLWRYADGVWLLKDELNVRSVKDSLIPTCISACVFGNCPVTLVGSNKGDLVIWSSAGQENKSFCVSKKFENGSAVDAAWEKSLQQSGCRRLAVGYKKGVLGVYQYQPATITSKPSISQLCRFYAHEKDICRVLWSPVSGNETAADDAGRADLLTAARDQLVKLWTITNSWCCGSVKVPGQSRVSRSNKNMERASSSTGSDSSVGAPWITACWFDTNDCSSAGLNIIISGLHGEFYQWSGGNANLAAVRNKSVGHTMMVFAMSYIENSPGFFLTIGQDRQVILWQQRKCRELLFVERIPTLAGGVFALAEADHGNGPVAVGVGDGSIILWRPSVDQVPSDLESSASSESTDVRDRFVTFWPRGPNTSSVTALAWHPSPQYNNILVYGTESGCVELIDVMKLSKKTSQKSKTNPYVFGSTVYRVAWGPRLFDTHYTRSSGDVKEEKRDSIDMTDPECLTEVISDKSDVFRSGDSEQLCADGKNKFAHYVYSVCKGKIFLHLGFKYQPVDVTLRFPAFTGADSLEEWSKVKRTDISFLELECDRQIAGGLGPDPIAKYYDYIISVGYRSGYVDIFARCRCDMKDDKSSASQAVALLRPICRIHNHLKGINCFAWCRSRYWLAVGSNEPFITVNDLTDVLFQSTKEPHSSFKEISACLARLDGHCNRVTCLDWSPHVPNLLLSASFDGTANVWEINDPKNVEVSDVVHSLANFRANRLRLFTCLWSRREADLAYSGGELCHLLCWRPSKLMFREPPNTRRYRPPLAKEVDEQGGLELVQVFESSTISDEVKEQTLECASVSDVAEDAESKKPPKPQTQVSTDNRSSKRKAPGLPGDKRKRPALFPRFLCRDSADACRMELSLVPPLRVGSKYSPILYTLNLVNDGIELPSSDIDLLFLLPENERTRKCILRLVSQQAEEHLKSYKAASRPNSLSHLDAYCMILLWLGRVSSLSRIMAKERHMPFWLLWAFQLYQSTVPSFCGCADLCCESSLDILEEKIKEMTSNSPDALVAATLLICAGRAREAVDYLVNHDRLKEALVAARIRLSSIELEPIVQICVSRLRERGLISSSMPCVEIVHQVGSLSWDQARLSMRRLVVGVGSRAGEELEQLAVCWIELRILLSSPSSSSQLRSTFTRLGYLCLVTGFELSFPDCNQYLEQWLHAVGDSSSLSDDAPLACLLLLQTGMHFCSYGQNVSNRREISFDWIKKSFSSQAIASVLLQLTPAVHPFGSWAVCLAGLAVDFTICNLICTAASSESEIAPPDFAALDEYFERLAKTVELCAELNLTETVQLCDRLCLFISRHVHCSDPKLLDGFMNGLTIKPESPLTSPVSTELNLLAH